MKILVGVMYSIEHEFTQCMAAIQRQTLPPHSSFVISGLPNKLAHDHLYQTFMARAQSVDLFVKIDADMVLTRDTFLEECARFFSARPDLEHLQIAVDDWMTGTHVYGLHCYRSTHTWMRSSEKIFVDMEDVNAVHLKDDSVLAPAAVHCPDPSPFQAYHFGVHKGVKFVQKGAAQKHDRWRATHWRHYENLNARFVETGDRRHALALVGFRDAVRKSWGASEVDYSSSHLRRHFAQVAALSDETLSSLASEDPIRWLSRCPHPIRYEINALRVRRPRTFGSAILTACRLLVGSYRRRFPVRR